MIIDGQRVAGAKAFDVLNPATEEVVGKAPQASETQVNQALEAAQRAFGSSWSQDRSLRAAALSQAGEKLAEAASDIGRVLTQEQGKPLAEARREVELSAQRLQYFSQQELAVETVQRGDVQLKLRRVPFGPVAAITPWNSPLITAANKVGAALITGNSLILKPSPFTPLSTLMMGDVIADCFPPGVFNVLSGKEPVGQLMTEHPLTRKISLTGSIPTGKAVSAAAGKDLKRVTLELGGNDAAIVLENAEPTAIADDIFAATFGNAGQVCVAIKRLYVHETLYDELADLLVTRAQALKVGNGLEAATEMGPLATLDQLSHVMALVDDARKKGGSVAHGGQRSAGKGYFYEPTIILNARSGMRVVDEEQFGPVVPLIRYGDLSGAIAEANATQFGLGGSVWGSNPEECRDIAQKISAGVVWINAHKVLAGYQPLAGMRWSGLGVQGGDIGLAEYAALQVIWNRNSL